MTDAPDRQQPVVARTRYTVDLTDHEAQELRALMEPGRLRKKPARRRRETEDQIAPVLRLLAGLTKRAEGDVDLLAQVAAMAAEAETVLTEHVRQARAIGVEWGEIGDRLGLTRQGARQRFNRRGVN